MENQKKNTPVDPALVAKRRAILQKQWICSAAEVLEMAFDDAGLWRIETLVPTAALTIITGPSDVGKSSLLRQMAFSIAVGEQDFLGYKIYPDGKGVLFLASEDGWRGTYRGLLKQLVERGIQPPPNLFFVTETHGFIKKVEMELKKGLIKTVFIDPWSNIFAGDPNSYTSVRNNLNHLKDLAEKYDATIIMLHHNVKSGDKEGPNKSKLNGSQGIEACVRSVIDLRLGEGHSDLRVMTLVKANFVDNKEKMVGTELQLDGCTMIFTVTGKRVRFDAEGKIINSTPSESQKNWGEIMDNLRFDENGKALSLRKHLELIQNRYPDERTPTFHQLQKRYAEKTTEEIPSFTVDDALTPLRDEDEIAKDVVMDQSLQATVEP